MWHLDYLKHHRKFTYNRLQTECKLNSHLCDINSQAEEMFDTLIKQLKESEGITEQLKATPHISKKYRIQKKNTRQISRV